MSQKQRPAGTWTYEDLFSLPNDGRRYEIIEGELGETPSPGSTHAFVVAALIRVLIPLVEKLGGRWCTAPIDVFFAGANPVQPDILAIFPGGPARIVSRGIEGAPDLLVEVLSPSNRGHDLLTKRALHARAGVREYWLVDPDARTIEILTLDRDAFHLAVAASGAETPVSPLLGPVPITGADLFAGIDA
jgi:Uma2 family endonuclease